MEKSKKKSVYTIIYLVVYVPLLILDRTIGPSRLLDFFRALTMWGAMMTYLNIDFHEQNKNAPGEKNKNQIIVNSVMVVILIAVTILIFVL